MGYTHADHGNMEWYDFEGFDGKGVSGWRCARCHVIATPEDADEVFDEHDCDRYAELQEGITGAL